MRSLSNGVVAFAVMGFVAWAAGLGADDVPRAEVGRKLIEGKWKAYEGGTETLTFTKEGRLVSDTGQAKISGKFRFASKNTIEWTPDNQTAAVTLGLLLLNDDQVFIKNRAGQVTKYKRSK